MKRHGALLFLAILGLTLPGCVSARRVSGSELTARHTTTYTVDTTHTRYTLELVHEYLRDTLVRTIYREVSDERKGATQLHDTVYIDREDTVEVSTGDSAPVGEGVAELQQSRERTATKWLAIVVILSGAVVVWLLLRR